MFSFFKNILLGIASALIGILIFILGFILLSHQNVTIQNPFLPTTHFSLENAPNQSLKADIVSLSGKVTWVSRTAVLGKLISSPISLGQGEEIAADGNGAVAIEFPDAILVQMNSNSI